MEERFKEFLKEKVKAEVYNFNIYLEDLKNQYSNTANCQYELSKFESKSGNPEIFFYDEEEIQKLMGE